MHLSLYGKIPKYYMYCIICLAAFVIQTLKYLTLHDYPKAVIFGVGSMFAFLDAYSLRWKLDAED